jgi:hypothetical protein
MHDITAIKMVGEGVSRLLFLVVGHSMASLRDWRFSSRCRDRRSIPLSPPAARVYFRCIRSCDNDEQRLDDFAERA